MSAMLAIPPSDGYDSHEGQHGQNRRAIVCSQSSIPSARWLRRRTHGARSVRSVPVPPMRCACKPVIPVAGHRELPAQSRGGSKECEGMLSELVR